MLHMNPTSNDLCKIYYGRQDFLSLFLFASYITVEKNSLYFKENYLEYFKL